MTNLPHAMFAWRCISSNRKLAIRHAPSLVITAFGGRLILSGVPPKICPDYRRAGTIIHAVYPSVTSGRHGKDIYFHGHFQNISSGRYNSLKTLGVSSGPALLSANSEGTLWETQKIGPLGTLLPPEILYLRGTAGI